MVSKLVSVIIPCYNQAHFLNEAIESALNQTYPHVEIIVVDDGSIDNTPKVAARYPGVRYIRQDNQGPSVAQNTGLLASSGEYVIFMGADDRLLLNGIEVGLKHLSANPECGLVSGQVRLIASDGSPLSTPEQLHVESDHYAALLRDGYIWTPAAVIYRSSVLDIVGGFDTTLVVAEDFELNLRIARNFPICSHDKVVAEYRMHGENLTCKSGLMLKYAFVVIRMQRKYIEGNRHYEEAYRAGIKNKRRVFGERLLKEFINHMRAHRWMPGMQDALVLVQYYPRGFLKAVLPGLYCGFYKVKDMIGNSGRKLRRLILFQSIGSISAAPTPVLMDGKSPAGVTNLAWASKRTEAVEVHVGSPDGPLFCRSGSSGNKTTGEWVVDGMAFYLQDVSGGRPLTIGNTISKVTVNVTFLADVKL